MFGKVAAFEFKYQVKQPVFWVAAIFFALLTFGAVASSNVQIGSTANVHKNAATVIAQIHLVFTLIYMFVTAAFVASIIVRDDDTGFGAILRSTPLSRFNYLYGRFAGAFAAASVAFLAVPLGLILGSAMPWVDPETVGPFVLQHYLFAYFVMALPGVLLTSAIFFALTSVTRSMLWAYIAAVALMIAQIVLSVVLGKPGLERVAALAEPFGFGAFGAAVRYWTAAERNTMMPALSGDLLLNRLIWLGVAFAILALTYKLFRPFVTASSPSERKSKGKASDAPPPAERPHVVPEVSRRSAWAQLVARTRLDMSQVFKSPAYLVLLGLAAALSVANLWLSTELSLYGGRTFPVTRAMIEALSGNFNFITLIIATYYAGELVWRDHDRKMAELIDATPVPDWAYVVPKTLAIALVLASTFLVSVVMGVLIQALKGYFHFEIGRYLLWWVLPQAFDCLLLAALAVFIQVLSPHKFVGWGLMVAYLVATIVAAGFGLEHNLYIYGGVPVVPMSEMNGLGRFWIGAWWFRLYWAAFAVLLLVACHVLWRRGTETRLWPRLRAAPRRLMGRPGLVAAGALAVFVASGVFIFINTNVWNEYRTNLSDERWQADYEKALFRYEATPQPKIATVKLDVDIYPHEPRVETRGAYVVENRTDKPLREVHLRFDRDLQITGLSVEGGRPKRTYERFNYRIFTFDSPMQPGERRKISFSTVRAERGFRNSSSDTRDDVRVVDNGTFVNDTELAPGLGFSRDPLLKDRAKRRKYKLQGDLRPALLGDVPSRQFNALRRDSDWVTSDITVSTVADQTPIAPGEKVFDQTSGGRRVARFVTSAPILDFFSIQSARYAVKNQTYKGVALSVFYHPEHAWNVDRMFNVMKTSLDYYQSAFSPYQFKHLRFLEFPGYANFAQSFAGTIPWSENLGFIADYRDPSKIDLVTYVGAHEIAHQWWAHQLVGADQQGGSAMAETLAQYSALMVMRRTYGEPMIRKFLKFELDRYLRARGGEVVEELPLERVENQPYIHYNKGSLVMYRLADEIGEDNVNAALRDMLGRYAFKGAPYPTMLELVAAIRAHAPADKQNLITDLFEKITVYDIKTTGFTTKRRPDGKYDVTLTVDARKLYADGKGKEVAAPMNEALDVGLFTAMPGDKAFSPKSVLVFEKRPIHSGRQTITLVSPVEPKFAGVDPYNKLIDRNSDDNIGKPQ